MALIDLSGLNSCDELSWVGFFNTRPRCVGLKKSLNLTNTHPLKRESISGCNFKCFCLVCEDLVGFLGIVICMHAMTILLPHIFNLDSVTCT